MLTNFIIISCISTALIFISWVTMYEILDKVWNILPKIRLANRLRVMLVGIPIFIAHIIGIWVYGLAYFLIENYTSLGGIAGHGRDYGVNWESFFDCLYFSAATYSSLGFGDFVPTGHLRMLVGAEVLNGLLVIGWTISFTFLTMEKFWAQPNKHK
jgi:hypothetical protein